MDVKYRSSQWDKAKDSLRNLIGLGVWGKGMIDTMKDITDNLDEASEKVAKYDSDGVVSFSYTSDKDKYQRLFEDFKVLEDFSGNVGDIVEDKIDQPFYEDIDAFVQKVRDSSISNYTTSNHIGATETIPISYYGSYQEYETEKTEITIDDILSGDNYYADQIKTSFEEWKVQNPDEDISYEDYRTAAVNTRAFEYESIEDGQFTKEFWVNIAALVVIVGVTVVCPPAGAVLGAAYATVEMGSAISGQDWASGRELDTSERWTRGLLAPLDVLPIGNAVTSFTGTARTTSRVVDLGGLLNKTKLSSSLTHNISNQTSQVLRLVETAGQQTSTRLRTAAHTVTNTTNILKNKLGEEAVRIAQMGDAGITRVLNMFPQVGAVTDNGLILASSSNFNKLEEGATKVANRLGSPRITGAGNAGVNDVKTVVEKGQQFTNGRRNRLKPNIRYQTGEYDYFYETDTAGRITKFETDKLQLTTREDRLPHSKNTLGKVKGQDHAGHLAGDRFGGSPKIDNLVSQLSDVNLREYKKIEAEWATALSEVPPKAVKVDVKIIYSGNDLRPDKFIVNYFIDGKPGSKIIKN
ncbi:DNA/RNA non-specific endonuclease [Terribacillus saccharophilus]|uniref:DNA/RNA non-specific endonuclease n=1 Tax=Terribacillus saccharophilus TaxID=361277 RepID=UPI002DD41267|nr:DNA/RNA non-specific endonuclease [Terribacillus saccharophilus]